MRDHINIRPLYAIANQNQVSYNVFVDMLNKKG